MMQSARKTVVFGLFAYRVDGGVGEQRWSRWRPLLELCASPDITISKLYLFHRQENREDIEALRADIRMRAPHLNFIAQTDAGVLKTFDDFYLVFYKYFKSFKFDTKHCQYYLYFPPGIFPHVTLALVDIIRTLRLPLEIIQVYQEVDNGKPKAVPEVFAIDASKVLQVDEQRKQHSLDDQQYLKSGILTRNAAFNALIARLEHVALHSCAPMLISGPTGAGKSHLVRRMYALKLRHGQLSGPLVEVNCSSLHGDMAAAALFGHVKGAFTGADAKRAGLLRKAHNGLLFLDEVGELGLAEQALLLKAIEERRFLPVGSDVEVESHFQLVCGTNRDLAAEVQAGRFRLDLLTRINLWHFHLPSLRERCEDIAPNVAYELERLTRIFYTRLQFTADAYTCFLDFATSPAALWPGNFRELAAVMERMATFHTNGNIVLQVVEEELRTLRAAWSTAEPAHAVAPEALPVLAVARDTFAGLQALLGPEVYANLDLFERIHLAGTIDVCLHSSSMSAAGRTLYAVSRTRKNRVDDANRLHNYLKKYGLNWRKVHAVLG